MIMIEFVIIISDYLQYKAYEICKPDRWQIDLIHVHAWSLSIVNRNKQKIYHCDKFN